MDKQSKQMNKNTFKIVNKMYEQISLLECMRMDLRYFNYDGNDEVIDNHIYNIKGLLDDIYEKNIQKKCGCYRSPSLSLQTPKTPVSKNKPSVTTPPPAPRKNILNDILDYESDDDSMASSSSGQRVIALNEDNRDSQSESYLSVITSDEDSDEEYHHDSGEEELSDDSVGVDSDDDSVGVDSDDDGEEDMNVDSDEDKLSDDSVEDMDADSDVTRISDSSEESDDDSEESDDDGHNYCPYCLAEV